VPPSFDHVLGDARLRDLKPELKQFNVGALIALENRTRDAMNAVWGRQQLFKFLRA